MSPKSATMDRLVSATMSAPEGRREQDIGTVPIVVYSSGMGDHLCTETSSFCMRCMPGLCVVSVGTQAPERHRQRCRGFRCGCCLPCSKVSLSRTIS